MIEPPKQDPNSDRIEVLTREQFQNLLQEWESQPDRKLTHLNQFTGWRSKAPGSPEVVLEVCGLERGNYTKRDTKSGQTMLQPMNERVRGGQLRQRGLLNNSSAGLSRKTNRYFPQTMVILEDCIAQSNVSTNERTGWYSKKNRPN